MLLEHDRPARTISRSEEVFIDSNIAQFNLTPGPHLSAVDCPALKDKFEELANQPYKELVVALAWLALGTRPDIAFATSSLGTTSVASIGTRPNEYYVTSRAPSSGVSRWEASPQRSPPSRTLTGEVIATTDTQSESIPSAEKVVTLRDDKGVGVRFVVDVEGFCCEGRGQAVANVGGVGNWKLQSYSAFELQCLDTKWTVI